MANIENLKPLTSERAKEVGRKGGIKKAEKMRKAKTFAEAFKICLEQEITNTKGETKTTLEAIIASMVAKAIKGDVKAAQFVRDTIGQMPVAKQEILSANLNMQKIFVTKNDELKADKHIEEFIDG